MPRMSNIQVLSDEKFLFTDITSSIKMYDAGNVRDSAYSTESLLIVCVHKTHDKCILFGARETKKAFPLRGRRVVIMMSLHGKVKQVWEFDGENAKRLFINLRKLSSSTHGNMLVIDILGGGCRVGRIADGK